MDDNQFTTKIHDIIVPSDSKEEFNSLFIIMDFWERDLVTLLKLPKIQLSEDHAIAILYNILCSIKFLHEAGIIHRDLKPANILVNDQCQIRICDFGLSTSIKEHKTS